MTEPKKKPISLPEPIKMYEYFKSSIFENRNNKTKGQALRSLCKNLINSEREDES